MLIYLFQVTVCLACFYGFYFFALRRETLFHTNRMYLMITLMVSLVLPLLKIYVDAQNAESNVVVASSVYVGNYVQDFSQRIVAPSQKSIPWLKILTGLYLLGAAVMAVRLLIALRQILDIRKTGLHSIVSGHVCVLSEEVRSPFSFFDTIYLPKNHSFTEDELNEVIAHEMAHVSGLHTWDVILMELLCIKLWPSPMIYLYRKSLKEVHEFVADEAVLKETPWENYAQLLVTQQQGQLQNILSNQLIYSQLKKRLLMMNKERSGFAARYKYLGIIPVLLIALAFFVFREKPTAANELPSALIGQQSKEEVLLFVTNDQRYYVGANEVDKTEIDHAVIELTKGIPDPVVKVILESANQFTVGEISEILDIENKLHSHWILDLDEEGNYDSYKSAILAGKSDFKADTLPESYVIALRLTEPDQQPSIADEYTNLDYTQGLPIFPGCDEVSIRERGDCGMKKLGEYINEHMVYPESLKKSGKEGRVLVKFVVDANGFIKDVVIQQSLDPAADQAVLNLVNGMNANVGKWRPARKEGKSFDAEMVLPVSFALSNSTIQSQPLKEVDEMTRFPGCEKMTKPEERNACAQEKMFQFVYSNIMYPKEDREKNIEGTGIARFVIGEDGKISDIEVLRSPSPGIKAELMRVINVMAALPERWVPAQKDGKPVAFQLILPVKFKLQDAEKKLSLGPVSAEEPPYAYVEEMPRFNGCDDIVDQSERTKCSSVKLYEFVNKNIQYPAKDKENKIEGQGIVQFVVEADGSLSNIRVLRSPSPTISAEIMRMMNVMAALPDGWLPGKHNGVAVPVTFTLPVKFKLQEDQVQSQKQLSTTNDIPVCDGINIVPNPAAETISINIIEGSTSLNIFDGVGRLVKSQKVTGKAEEKETINVTTLPAGRYTIQLMTLSGAVACSFTIVK